MTIIDINKRTSVCLLSISGFQLGDGLSSPKKPQTCLPRHVAFFAICRPTHRRTTADVGTSLCIRPFRRVKVGRFRVDTSRQVDEVLTVIYSLMINDGRNKIMFFYSLDDWHKRSGVVSGNDFYLKNRQC